MNNLTIEETGFVYSGKKITSIYQYYYPSLKSLVNFYLIDTKHADIYNHLTCIFKIKWK
jgi:hypothetical protein